MLAVLAVGVVRPFEMVACGEAVVETDAVVLGGELSDLGEITLALISESESESERVFCCALSSR